MSAALASSCLQTVRLPDGTLVTLRSIRPSDRSGMRRAFARLSRETRYQRFHAHVSDLPERAWTYLTHVDGHHHVALVARVGSRIVGVARFIRLRDAVDGAEIAFVVADDFQRRGLGRALRQALLAEARRRGIAWFQATVLPDSVGIRRLLMEPPLSLISDRGDQLVVRLTPQL
jgi:GNAT superfamily N-acetyltransferase